jgi:hypothetical protein
MVHTSYGFLSMALPRPFVEPLPRMMLVNVHSMTAPAEIQKQAQASRQCRGR